MHTIFRLNVRASEARSCRTPKSARCTYEYSRTITRAGTVNSTFTFIYPHPQRLLSYRVVCVVSSRHRSRVARSSVKCARCRRSTSASWSICAPGSRHHLSSSSVCTTSSSTRSSDSTRLNSNRPESPESTVHSHSIA